MLIRNRVCWVAVTLTLALAGLVRAAPLAQTNVLFIAIDDLRNDLGVLGVREAQTPKLDQLAASSRLFANHYVQVPTCGASRCALLRGMYPTEPVFRENNAILKTHEQWGARSLPATLRQAGYRTYALGKITHYPGGLTGGDWNAPPEELPGAWTRSWNPETPWGSAQALMHGYANGVRRVPGKSPPAEAVDAPDLAYPDAWVADEAVAQLTSLATSGEPWFFAVGFFKPHLPFASPQAWLERHADDRWPTPPVGAEARAGLQWGGSGEMMGNYGQAGRDPRTETGYAVELRRAYAAAASYLDAQIGRVLDSLAELGLADDTVIVVWSDHGFLLGEHDMWGKHTLYARALRSPLMVRYPGLPMPGRISPAVVETIDVFPTIADLCGVSAPAGLEGNSLRPFLENPAAKAASPARSWWGQGQSIITDRWQLIAEPAAGNDHPAVELFDLKADPAQTRNVASDHPEVVAELLALRR